MSFLSRKRISWLPALIGVFALVVFGLGCSGQTGEKETGTEGAPAAEAPADTMAAAAKDEVWPPEHIVVQHVLIGFKGSIRGKNITRSKEEAEALAKEVLAKAQAGENFGALVTEYTDDQAPGFYFLANTGVEPNDPNEYPRDKMVKGFGDVAFSLHVGEIGMAEYNEKDSPFGWHIIKRVQPQ